MRGIRRVHVFVVEGEGPFPREMLRLDRCNPKPGEMLDETTEQRRVEMVTTESPESVPTEARWASFGWRVIPTFREVRQRLRTVGVAISFRAHSDEYRVNFRGGREATAYYTSDIEDALGTGLDMARRAVANQEVLIAPAHCYSFKLQQLLKQRSEVYEEYTRTRKVGDVVRAYAGAPGTGHVDHRITRIDDTGVYGVVVEDTIRELTPEEVR